MYRYSERCGVRIHQSRIVVSTGAAVSFRQIGGFDFIEIDQSDAGDIGAAVFVILQIDRMQILSMYKIRIDI